LAQAATVIREITTLRNLFRSQGLEARTSARVTTSANKAVADSYALTGKAAKEAAKQQAQAARDAQRAIRDLKREMAGMANQAGVSGYMRAGAGALGVAGGASLIASGVRAYDNQQGLARSFRYRYGAQDGQSVFNQTRALSDTLGLPLKEVSTSLRQLSNNLDPEMLMRTMKAFIATGFITGADTEGMARALVQYTQIANYGRLQGDELRIMQEQGVNLVRVLQNAGLSDRIGSQTNPLTFEEVNTALLAFGESGDAVKMLGEVSQQGSVALTQMQNAITQDLLPALGKEFTPVVKDLAREMPRLVWAGRLLINNWEAIGGGMVTVWAVMKGTSIALTIQSLRAAKALALVAASGNAAAASQGGGLLGGGGWRRGSKIPKTAGASVFKDTLGQAGVGSIVPGAGSAGAGMGALGTAAGAGGVFVAGALALAGIVEGVGRLAGMSYDDTLFGQIENGLAGRGFKSGSQLRQEIDQEAERTFKPVREAEMRKAAYEKYRAGRRMSRTEYFMATGDDQIFATESRRAEMQAQRQRSEAERLDSQERNRQRNWDAQGRRGGTSPRRASIDRANAEANARLNYGAGF
jgi:tape measure domain-containing protein